MVFKISQIELTWVQRLPSRVTRPGGLPKSYRRRALNSFPPILMLKRIFEGLLRDFCANFRKLKLHVY